MRNVLTKLAVAAAALVGGVTSANAYVILTITDLSTATTTICNTSLACGVGWTIINSNTVSFTGTIGAFDVVATQGFGNTPGTPAVAFANTTSLSVNRNDGAAGLKGLKVTFDAIDFSAPIGQFKSLQGSASDTAGAGFFTAGSDFVASQFYVDSAGGTLFNSPLTAPPGSTAADGLYATGCFFFVSTNGSCAAPGITWADPSAPVGTFSARSEQQFALNAASIVQTTSSLTIRTVPEPMTTTLVGMALVGLAFASRRSAAKKA